jgi:hypothetical protein
MEYLKLKTFLGYFSLRTGAITIGCLEILLVILAMIQFSITMAGELEKYYENAREFLYDFFGSKSDF